MGADVKVLPRLDCFKFGNPPETEGVDVEFRLIYQGPLPAESKGDSRKAEKIAIRRALHFQLAELWKQEMKRIMAFSSHPELPKAGRNPEEIAERYKVVNDHDAIYRFVPLIGERYGAACSLDILFMRRDSPGGVVRHGGDIDNRIKVLFDALRMPQNQRELPDTPQATDENPLYCLLEDDKYITAVTVTTDRLLVPPGAHPGEHVHNVVLVIRVKTVVVNPLIAPWSFW